MSIELENGLGNSDGNGGGGKIPSQDGQEGKVLSTNGEQLEWVEGYKPNLFDLKINSEPTAQKGWSCISYPTQKKLNKSDVPTVYSILKNKLDTVDKASTGWQNSTSGYRGDIFYNSLDNYYYFYSGSAICKSRYIDLSNPITIASTSVGAFSMCVINNHTYFFTNGDGWDESTKIYDENGTLLKNFSIRRPNLPRIVIGNKAYTNIIGNYISIQDNKRYLALPYFDFSDINNIQFNENCIEEMDNQYIGNSVNLGNKFFACDRGSFLFEIDIDTLQWTSYAINSGIASSNPFVTGIFSNSKLIVMYNGGTQYSNGYYTRIYQFDINNKNFNLLYSYSNTSWIPSPIFDSAEFSRNCGIQILGEYYFFVANNNSSNKSSKIYQTTDFINFTEFYATTPTETFGYTIDNLLVSPKNEFAIHINHSYTGDTQYLYMNYISVVYTDTINGIDIKYYKSGDWKLCTPDIAIGNDTNLQSVYEYLGYLNYWWIDENNEQITLQRNSNMWTMMYVDDDYEDSSLPSGQFEGFATKGGNNTFTGTNKFEGNTTAQTKPTSDTSDAVATTKFVKDFAQNGEWQKPADWIDIRSGALDNSIYFLVAHSKPTGTAGSYVITDYPKFAFLARVSTSENTYDVSIDGIKIATMASGTKTEIDWASLYNNGTLVGGYDIAQPGNSGYTTHIIRITPTNLTDNFVLYQTSSIEGQQQQGLLWGHLELSNEIDIHNGFGGANTRNFLLQAVTAKGDKITYIAASSGTSGIYGIFAYAQALIKTPILQANNSDNATSVYLCFATIPTKKIVIKNNSEKLTASILSNFKGEEIDVENPIRLHSGTGSGLTITGVINLKKFPAISTTEKGETLVLSRADSLEPTFINEDFNDIRTLFRFHGTSGHITNLVGLVVSPEAPFNHVNVPQIDVSYTKMDRAALVRLFNSMPTVSDSQEIDITGAIGAGDLTAEDIAIATGKGWTVVR